MSKKVRKEAITAMAEIEKYSHDGRGIARIEGKTTFLQGALPGETVLFQYTKRKRDYDEGKTVSVLSASSSRTSPGCPHFALCGGCSLQHLDEAQQIHVKQAQLIDSLERIGHCTAENYLPPLTSEAWHYRHKARLSVRYVEKKQRTLIGFREKENPRYIAEISQCPVLVKTVDKHLETLRTLLDSLDTKGMVAQIEVAAGDKEIALIFRHLSPLSEQDEKKLRHFGEQTGFKLFLQPEGIDSVHCFFPENASPFLAYTLEAEGITLQFHPTDFTQVNAALNQKMIALAMQLMDVQQDDCILDLFCGLGNFSLPLAKRCQRVIGVEGSQAMVERAASNARLNGLENASFYCSDLDKANALDALPLIGFSKVLLDPPRTGALELVKSMDKLNPTRIVYVSCNPATLARDSDILVNQQGYRLSKTGVMDMFPHTAHVESIALFEKE